MWSFSISSFTSVIFIVTFRLMLTSRYFTWLNLCCIFFLSLGIYFIYVWGSNYTGFSATYQSIPTIFQSSHYYLSVIVCVGFCFLIDLLVQAWRFEISTNPTDYLRKLIAYEKDDVNDEYFEGLYERIRKKYI
jgi:hypothetical protein